MTFGSLDPDSKPLLCYKWITLNSTDFEEFNFTVKNSSSKKSHAV